LAGEEGDALEAAGVFGGPGADVGVVFEEVVDETALVGVHGVELDGLTGGLDFGGGLADAVEEALGFALTEVFDVETDAGGVGVFLAEEFVDEVLEVLETLAFAADQGFGLVHADVEGGPAGVVGDVDGDAVAEVAEHDVEDFMGTVGGIHSKKLGADGRGIAVGGREDVARAAPVAGALFWKV
jgi:hypothetical protein